MAAIRQATLLEVAHYCAERGIQLDANADPRICVIVSDGDASMLLVVKPIDHIQAEVHVSCPRKYIRSFHRLCELGFDYCKSEGFKVLFTTTNKRQIIDNSVKKLGFQFVCEYNDINVYRRVL